MKRCRIFFIVFMVFSVFVFTASGQNGFTGMIYVAENDVSDMLTENAKKKIADDYIKYIGYIGYEPEYIYIEYFGTYDGCELAAIEMQGSYGLNIVQTVDIAGYAFTSATPHEIFLHKNGTFIDISTAYDLGYLKYEDIGKAHQIFAGIQGTNSVKI